ncbi:anti-sigma factor family protein [Streptomyces sp. NPDC051315]|uniref:anti-sigma factor family protein n=1 Tax=Streptomyces sp. NPDC051315 TaxID=3365650 RepID=UPI0037967C1F
MTSTTDTTGHPDVAEISDLTEGLLPPSRSADVRRHLDACSLCADVHASLEEIRGLLGTLPGPPRMPDDVAHRIDAALAAEALLDATAPETAGSAEDSLAVSTASTTASDADAVVGTDADTDTAAHVSRETSSGASRPAGQARSSTTGPGRKERKRSGRRKVAALGAVFAVAALGLGSVLVSSLTDDGGPATSTQRPTSTAVDTFAESTLEQQVSDLLSKAQDSRTPDTLGTQGDPESRGPMTFQQPTVPACVQKGIGPSDAALATEKGTYQGKDALLVVLPDASDSTKVTAYLMDATCVEHPSAGTAEVLLKDTYTHR